MSQDFVNVPVPADRVQEIYELLARPKGSPATAPAAALEPRDVEIDVNLIVRAYRESPPAMKKFFDYLADNPEKDLRMEHAAAAVGYTPHQMAGALGAFGRRWKNRYHGGADAKWPFLSWWNFDINTMVYKMPAATAEVIKGI